MIKIEAWSLEEAYTLASEQLGCSITEIDCEITQYPSKGFLGIGKKKAILVAVKKQSAINNEKSAYKQPQKTEKKQFVEKKELPTKQVETAPTPVVEEKQEAPTSVQQKPATDRFDQIDKNFFKEERDIADICEEIEIDINKLFECSCFALDRITVVPYDKETVLITFSGGDSALLIGKEGYRYKALSYLLFNWINSKYDLLIRLEIAEFLKNQEDMIANYLEPLIEQIKDNRRGQTKILDGVLIQIALKTLREEFHDLYVGVKTNDDGSKYIIVNEFYARQNVK